MDISHFNFDRSQASLMSPPDRPARSSFGHVSESINRAVQSVRNRLDSMKADRKRSSTFYVPSPQSDEPKPVDSTAETDGRGGAPSIVITQSDLAGQARDRQHDSAATATSEATARESTAGNATSGAQQEQIVLEYLEDPSSCECHRLITCQYQREFHTGIFMFTV